jgi:predicted acylesterase/phospholipase RssA
VTTSQKPAASCDIVMKGGITSGVVYPLAMVELAKKFRFANIGGTSAGAIAAAAAAAAEYGRPIQDAGFARLEKVPQEVGPNLLSMFQPSPALEPLFNIFVAALRAKSKTERFFAMLAAAVRGYWLAALLGAAPGVIIAVMALLSTAWGWFCFGVLAAVVGLMAALTWRLLKAANTELPANDYGLCPGIRRCGSAPDGFTDWLALLIQEAAGRKPGDPPLTFGDLDAPPDGAPAINLAMVTTSLMEERPYTLPMQNERFSFRISEWRKIFPKEVMDFLIANGRPFEVENDEQEEFFYFPDRSKLPLIVGARMSLSFPGLISAVPLWTRDFTLRTDDDRQTLRRCLFSDGGLTSNFPIHFFDHLFPNSPTFAISLDDFDAARNYSNVWLPSSARSGSQSPILPFSSLGSFLLRLVYSAKDWQDNLQSTLPGYRERIVHVVLKPDEGGLNLTMSKETVARLVGYGQQAGIMLRDDFDMNEHRWRRFLVSMARMEQSLDEVAGAYEQVPGEFGDFLDRYLKGAKPYKSPEEPGHRPPYSQDTKARVEEMLRRAAQLVSLGTDWRNAPSIRDGDIPRPVTNLRITPKY